MNNNIITIIRTQVFNIGNKVTTEVSYIHQGKTSEVSIRCSRMLTSTTSETRFGVFDLGNGYYKFFRENNIEVEVYFKEKLHSDLDNNDYFRIVGERVVKVKEAFTAKYNKNITETMMTNFPV